jgi:hypothetical protein
MTIVGVRPWLPEPLDRWRWLTEPVRAERLAALRIGAGAVLLFDILVTYLPFVRDYYGPGGLAWPDVFASRFESPYWHWSILRVLPEAWGPPAALAVWALAAAALLVGWYPRVAAAVAWALSVSFLNSNYYIHNGGDRIRHLVLFFLMFAPSGAVWSVRSVRRGRASGGGGPVFIYPWPLRLLFLVMVLMYFFNGVYKLLGPTWRDGTVMYYVMHDVGWSRLPLRLPPAVLAAMAWGTIAWEVGFPVWLMTPRTRAVALWLGVAFHVGAGLQLELGMFGLHALCLYLPLVPWERYVDGRARTATACTGPARSLEESPAVA